MIAQHIWRFGVGRIGNPREIRGQSDLHLAVFHANSQRAENLKLENAMFIKIQKRFAHPILEDSEKTRAAELVNTMLFTQIGIFALALVALLISGNRPPVVQTIGGFVFLGFLLALLIPLRRGYIAVTGVIILVLITLMTGFTVAASGTIRHPILAMFLLASIFAGLAMGRRAAIVSTIINILIVTGVGYGEINRLLPPAETNTNSQHVVLFAMAGIFTVVLLNQALRRIETSLKLANVKQNELVVLNKELSNLNIELEQRVNERTAAAEAARQSMESQMWLAAGQAQLAEKMRGEQSIETLANHVTSHLCQYLGAQTGAFFLVSGQRLKLTGRYAYTEHPGQKDEFGFGENLVGEAARANRIISVMNIPTDAPLVASALGDAQPNQILIAPIETDGQVFGVMELATLNQFSAEHESFLRRVSESIAIAFRTAQTRERIALMLTESQQQAEELQAQEEELRAANEELQAQGENRASNEVPANRRQSARQL